MGYGVKVLAQSGGMARSAKVQGRPGCSAIKAAPSTVCALYAFNHAIMLMNRAHNSLNVRVE
jgi:hypothetical protein